jgi:2-polyprenyl-3-methyl-5-hydroxy-6-metoxy-1,4-benzoquinol methylase
MSLGKEYPSEFSEDSSHVHAVTLLERAGGRGPSGLVLDLGCGNAPIAEPLTARGFGYVGLDVDRGSLDGLVKRGYESHRLDLGVSESRLLAKLTEVVGERSLAAVFALDVLEHLVDPQAVVRALATLCQPHGASLIVSIPNITHVDVGVRLLLGRWDLTPTGLLDDTHLRFFSPEGFRRLFAGTGWQEVDAFDTVAPFSDQFVLQRSPGMQPGAPVGNFLRRLRERAGAHGTTYQFVRRFEPRPTDDRHDDRAHERPDDADRPFLTVVVETRRPGHQHALDRLRADLETQSDQDFEVVEVEAGPDPRNQAIVAARGSYLLFVATGHRLGPRLVECVRRAAGREDDPVSTDCVVRVDGGLLAPTEGGDREDFAAVADGVTPLELDGFDFLRAGELGHTVLACYAVPRSACETLGLRFESGLGDATGTAFIARAVELCSIRVVGDLQVLAPEGDVRPALDDLVVLREHLGPDAFLLPPGGLPRALVQREDLGRTRQAEQVLRAEVEVLRPRLERAERDRDATRAELDTVLATRTWRYSQRLRRLYARLRQVIAER